MPDDTTTDQTDTDQQSATDTDQANTSQTDTDGDKDWKAEAEKYKAIARKQEQKYKDAAPAVKELEELKKSQMSEVEKAVAAAKEEGRREALTEAGSQLVEAEIKAAAAGRNVDVAALVEGVDKARFLTDEGKADTDAITAWVDKIAPEGAKGPLDLGQGNLGGATDDDAFTTAARAAMGLPEKKG